MERVGRLRTTTGCSVTVQSSNREHNFGNRCSNDLRQLYANLVVKLEGKALDIVQLVGKGEGLEASVEVGIRGHVWEQTGCCGEFSTREQAGKLTRETDARW